MNDKEQKEKCKKELIYYEKVLEALMSNSIELDKSILYLSSGAIALIIQIVVNNKNILECCCSKMLLTMSGVMFLFCIFGFFIISVINSKMLKSSIKEDVNIDKLIKSGIFLDNLLKILFFSGALFFVIFILIYLWKN